MNENNVDNPMNSEEIDEKVYADLLREAYPQPSAEMKENVMARVRHERVMRKKNTKAAARRMASVSRWAAIAACAVIVCGLVVALSPKIQWMKDAGVAEMADMAENAACEANLAADMNGMEAEPEEAFAFTKTYAVAQAEKSNDDTKRAFGTANLNLAIVDEDADLVYGSAYMDVNGDGESEFVKVWEAERGFVISVLSNGDLIAEEIFETESREINFEYDGEMLLRVAEKDGTYYFRITLKDGVVTLTEKE